MDSLFNLFKSNKDKIKDKITYLSEEYNIYNIYDIKKINGIISPEVVDNINNYIKEIQPTIMIGINKFKLTALLSKITANDVSYETYLKAGTAPTLPKTFVLYSILLPIRNQGTTNCCVAFSTACAIEYKNIMSNKYLDYLSPAFIYNNRRDLNVDNGMDSKNAIDIVKNLGVAIDKLYTIDMLNKKIDSTIYDNAINYKILNYNYITTLDTLKYALFNNGPVIAILPVFQATGIFWRKPENYNNNNFGYHCINFVGYDDTEQKLLMRNSWGTNWGINGYQWFPYSEFSTIVEAWTLLPSSNQPNESIYSSAIINDTSPNDDYTIIGLEPTIFYSLLAGVIIFIILLIIIFIIRYKQNKQNK
jgi:hypothetical protein